MDCNTSENSQNLGFELLEKAIALQDDFRFQDAATYLRNAANFFSDHENHVFYVKCLNNLSVVLSYMGNESMSAACYIEGLDYIEKNNCPYLSHIFYTNIGTRYQELGDYGKCLYYYLLADENMKRNGVIIPGWQRSESWRVAGSINLGYAYFYLKDYSNAEKNLLIAKEYEDSYSYTFFNISIDILLCRIHCINKDIEFCNKMIPIILERCKTLYTSLNDYTQDISFFVDLAKDLKRYSVWKQILETYSDIVGSHKCVTFHLKAVEFWLDYYAAMGMHEEYKDYCVKYTKLSKEIKIEENNDKIAALNNKIALHKKEQEFKQVQNLSQVDELTLLGNRYAIKSCADKILSDTADEKTKLGIGILDLDCFKNLNDNYGHLAGDFALKTIGNILTQCLKGQGSAYRYGGDEFMLIIPNCSKDLILGIALKIRDKISDAKIPNNIDESSSFLTISQGYYMAQVTESCTIFSLLDCADKALYDIKKSNYGNGIKILSYNSSEIEVSFP